VVALSKSPSDWNHLHWSTLFFDAVAHIRQILLPAIFAVLGAAQGSNFWLWIALLLLLSGALVSLFRFATLRYCIRDRQLIVNQGLIFRRVRAVPVDRIQNVDFVQNLLHRLLNVAEIRVETASGNEPEATLRVLSLTKVEQLRNEIFELKDPAHETPSADSTHDVGVASGVPDLSGVPGESSESSESDYLGEPGYSGESEVPSELREGRQTSESPRAARGAVSSGRKTTQPVPILEIPVSWLLKAGVASNRGMIMLGILLGVVFQSDWFDRIDFDQLKQMLPSRLEQMNWWLASSIGIIAALILLRLLGMAWYLLRFYDYRLVRQGEDLRISCGLLTRVNATVPRRRVQFISVHRSWIMRWMKLSSIRIETAGGSKNHDDASQSVSSRWFVPVVPDHQVAELLSQLRPGLQWDDQNFEFQSISPRAMRRRLRISLVFCILLGVIGLAIYQPWGWLAGLVSLPPVLYATILRTRSIRYARTHDGIVFRSGVLTRKTSITFFEKIQSVSVVQSPFDRRWKMAQLAVDTAAAGPADHRIEIPMLDQSVAFEVQSLLKTQAAFHQPVFA
jgi:putative membrane protein